MLTVQVQTRLYTEILSLLVIEIESKGESLSVSVSDCICMRSNEMLYDFVNVE